MGRSPSSYWCMIRDHVKLRDLVKYKMEQKKLKLKTLSEETGIPAYRISRWLHKHHPSVTQFQLVKLCSYLGIEIKIKVEIVD